MKPEGWHPIKEHYDHGFEQTRIGDEFNFERLRTLSILSRHMPKSPAVVYDIGGATGVYAFPLSQKGYEVHLIEPIESQVKIAKDLNAKATRVASIAYGILREDWMSGEITPVRWQTDSFFEEDRI